MTRNANQKIGHPLCCVFNSRVFFRDLEVLGWDADSHVVDRRQQYLFPTATRHHHTCGCQMDATTGKADENVKLGGTPRIMGIGLVLYQCDQPLQAPEGHRPHGPHFTSPLVVELAMSDFVQLGKPNEQHDRDTAEVGVEKILQACSGVFRICVKQQHHDEMKRQHHADQQWKVHGRTRARNRAVLSSDCCGPNSSHTGSTTNNSNFITFLGFRVLKPCSVPVVHAGRSGGKDPNKTSLQVDAVQQCHVD